MVRLRIKEQTRVDNGRHAGGDPGSSTSFALQARDLSGGPGPRDRQSGLVRRGRLLLLVRSIFRLELAGPPWRPISDGVRFHDRQIRSQAELTQQHLRFIADLSADPTTQWTEIEVGEAASRVHSGSAVDEGLEVAGDPDSLSRQATLSGKDPDQCEVDHAPERFRLDTALFSPRDPRSGGRGKTRSPAQPIVPLANDRR